MSATAKHTDSIFWKAQEFASPERRAAYLDQACGGDALLRAQIDELLGAYPKVDRFLESPAVAFAATCDHPTTEHIGSQIGRYKLLEKVGEGGMGVVYVAEQTEPVRRRVALKVIKPGMDTRQVIARFEAERQALAMMDHPNIAKIFDAGTTGQSTKSQASSIKQIPSTKSKAPNEAGSPVSDIGPSDLEIVCDLELGHCDLTAFRPYFVMELVRGRPITEHCDQEQLIPRQRLALFMDVCQAVQHAHQKGIIHRDIKPSNVMITLHDGVPVVKVIDFGVAKAIGHQLTERTVYTALTQLVGTPLYMSPEQAELSGLDIDTRSDVYSLGVLLYELLTGTTPFDQERLKKAGFDEMRRIIREEEPETVSQRLARTRSSERGARSNECPAPRSEFRTPRFSELDWIVMKALEKDRTRRYESPSAFAADIQRYLSDEPVLACPPTAMYRFQKFARKYKTALTTAAAIAVCLILGTTVSAWQAVRATTAEAQANANEQKAVANEQKAVVNAAAAEQKEQEAIKQRDEVKALNDKLAAKEQQLQRSLYASNMNLAKTAWDAGTVARVENLLAQHRPKPGEPDLRGFEWHYLHRLCHPELLTIKGAGGFVSYSPDGKRLASRDKVWDAQTGQELLTIDAGNLVFSPDGKRLASVSNLWDEIKKEYTAHDLKVWNSQTGQEILSIPVKNVTGGVRVVAYSPDGKRLAAGTGGYEQPKNLLPGESWKPLPGDVRVWDAITGQELQTLKGFTGPVENVVFSPDSKRLASPSYTDTKLWDVETGQVLLELKDSAGPVAFSPDGKRLATCKRVATGSGGRELKILDAQTGQELLSPKDRIESVAFSPDGKQLAGGTIRGGVKIWDAQTGEELVHHQGFTTPVESVAFSPDGKNLASANRNGVTKVWDTTTTNRETRTFSGPSDNVFSVTLSPDGKRLAGIIARDPIGNERNARVVKVWDAQTGQELLSLNEGLAVRVYRVVFSPDGKRLATGSGTWDDTKKIYIAAEAKVWDAQTGQALRSYKGHIWPVTSLAFSPDGTRMLSCSCRINGIGTLDPPGEAKVWDVQTGQELLTLTGHKRFVNSAAFSPDGKRIATLARDDTLKVWDAQTGQEIMTLNVRSFSQSGSVVFSPDGRRLASSHSPPEGGGYPLFLGEIRVWDAQTGQELLSLNGHTAPVASLVFSPDGKRLASGALGRNSRTGEVMIWDAQTGHELLTLKGAGFHDGLSFSPDGHRLASDSGGKVTIWDATPLPEKP